VEGKNLGDTYLQPTLLYRNQGQGKFVEVTSQAGPAFQVARPARGLALGDLDGSGRPEIVIVNMNGVPSVLKNMEPRGHYVNVKLEATESNRSAIGARVTVTAAGRRRVNEVFGASSFYSQHSATLHFGLGELTKVDSVEVRWPTGRMQTTPGFDADQTVRIREPRGKEGEGGTWAVTKP